MHIPRFLDYHTQKNTILGAKFASKIHAIVLKTGQVVIPILPQHYLLLQKNLIYTAVTRGKRLVVMVGSKKALAMGIRNERTLKRYTYLEHRLKGL